MRTKVDNRHPFTLFTAMEDFAHQGALKDLLENIIKMWSDGSPGSHSMEFSKEVEVEDEKGKSVFAYTYQGTVTTVAPKEEKADEDSTGGED